MARRSHFAQIKAAAPAVLPSLLMCDFGHLADEVRRLEQAGARVLHLDVMDGHFVPNLTYGLTIVEAVRKLTELPLDAHLMISNPEDFVEKYYQAGADNLTVHVEATADAPALLRQIRALGAGAAIALNPDTPVTAIEPCLADCDEVLVMSVQPGFGGQQFDARALDKLAALRDRVGDDILLGVDGGVHDATIGSCAEAGARLFIAGSAIFAEDDYAVSFARLSDLANHCIRA